MRDRTGSADVLLATPRRFLRPDRLVPLETALQNLLDVIELSAIEAQARGLHWCLVGSEQLPDLPEAALILSHHTVDGPAFRRHRAGGARVLHFKTGDLPRSVTFDPEGFAGWSSLANKSVVDLDLAGLPAELVDGFYRDSQTQILAGDVSKYRQKAMSEDLPERFVFVALQTIGDMVQRNAYLPMLEMLEMVVARFADSGISVVVKRHPRCRSLRVAWALRRVGALPHVRVAQGSIHALMARAEALFTVNSSVGSEAMVHGLPVYCFGRSDYGGIAHQIRSSADLQRLTSSLQPRCTDAEIRRFHYYYRNIHQSRGRAAIASRLTAVFDTTFGPSTD